MPAYLARELLTQAAIETVGHRLDEASLALDEALAIYSKECDELGKLHVSLGRARLLIERGDISSALTHLDALMDDSLVRPQTALRIEAVVVRLAAAIARSDTFAAEENLARYLAARREQPSATRDLRFFRPLAEYFARKEDWQKAAPAFRAAVQAIDEIASAWADPADRAMFLAPVWLAEPGRRLPSRHRQGFRRRATRRTSSFDRSVRK